MKVNSTHYCSQQLCSARFT